MKPPSPKADALRQMRERQHAERERKMSGAEKRRKGTWLSGKNREVGFIVGHDTAASWLKQNDPRVKRAKPKRHK